MRITGRLFGLASLAAFLGPLAATQSFAQEGNAAQLEAFEKLDINEDGLLSGTEVKTVAAMDADGDGRVTRAEYDAAKAKLGGSPADDQKRFAELDINEDGFLSGKEKAGLDQYDADRDGEISKAEYFAGRNTDRVFVNEDSLQKARADLEASLRRRAEQLFRAQDGNSDDRLSGTEIIPAYAGFDADADGRITHEEFLAGMLAEQLPGQARPAWQTTTIEGLGLSFQMPAKPVVSRGDDGSENYLLELQAGKLAYLVMSSPLSPEWKNSPEEMFQAVPERVSESGTLLNQQRDTVSGYPALMMTVRLDDGTTRRHEIIRLDNRLVQAFVINESSVKLDDADWRRFYRSVTVRPAADGTVPGEERRIILIPPGAGGVPVPPAPPAPVPAPAPAPVPAPPAPADNTGPTPPTRDDSAAAMQATRDYIKAFKAGDVDGVVAVCGLPWLADFKQLITTREELKKYFDDAIEGRDGLKSEVIKAEKYSVLRAQVNSDEFRNQLDRVVAPHDYVVSIGQDGVTYSAALVKIVDGRALVVGWTK